MSQSFGWRGHRLDQTSLQPEIKEYRISEMHLNSLSLSLTQPEWIILCKGYFYVTT